MDVVYALYSGERAAIPFHDPDGALFRVSQADGAGFWNAQDNTHYLNNRLGAGRRLRSFQE
jgi:hypothetical protein